MASADPRQDDIQTDAELEPEYLSDRPTDFEVQPKSCMQEKQDNDEASVSSLVTAFSVVQIRRPAESEDIDDYQNFIYLMPQKLKEDHCDILIINAEEDYHQALDFKKHLEKDIIVIMHGLSLTPRVKLLAEFHSDSPHNHLDFAFSKTLYVFLFITKQFCLNEETLLQGHAVLVDTIKNKTKRWCVVPVHTEPSKSVDYKLPMLLGSLRPIKYWSKDQFYTDSVRNLLQGRIASRLLKDANLNKERKAYFEAKKNTLKQKRAELIRHTDELKQKESQGTALKARFTPTGSSQSSQGLSLEESSQGIVREVKDACKGIKETDAQRSSSIRPTEPSSTGNIKYKQTSGTVTESKLDVYPEVHAKVSPFYPPISNMYTYPCFVPPAYADSSSDIQVDGPSLEVDENYIRNMVERRTMMQGNENVTSGNVVYDPSTVAGHGILYPGPGMPPMYHGYPHLHMYYPQFHQFHPHVVGGPVPPPQLLQHHSRFPTESQPSSQYSFASSTEAVASSGSALFTPPLSSQYQPRPYSFPLPVDTASYPSQPAVSSVQGETSQGSVCSENPGAPSETSVKSSAQLRPQQDSNIGSLGVSAVGGSNTSSGSSGQPVVTQHIHHHHKTISIKSVENLTIGTKSKISVRNQPSPGVSRVLDDESIDSEEDSSGDEDPDSDDGDDNCEAQASSESTQALSGSQRSSVPSADGCPSSSQGDEVAAPQMAFPECPRPVTESMSSEGMRGSRNQKPTEDDERTSVKQCY
ncbi:uncharacterized protein LOC101863943 isoform X2 [Aplysia californica]|nr:uncharacterized protein LOC101863943 isoform X2 [Aplysia californica]